MRVCILAMLLLCSSGALFSQKPDQPDAAAIYHQLQKLNTLGKVLYLAAHPDDENTRFISYCANEKNYQTAYLSLTRGDGGQNLIGPELREELGIMRTQELLAARRIDGGIQYFSRANDFGYSKTAEETLEIWDKDKILSDVVRVIRMFRPDIIVCRFPDNNYGGHGHHTASTLLGIEAFDLAADAEAYPEQLESLDTWQVKRMVVNTGRWWNDTISAEDPGVVVEDLGLYNPVLGTSYNEMAALSRSQHKCQGFGVIGQRGSQVEYFEHLKGEEAKISLFDGIGDDWSRIGDSGEIASLMEQILKSYDVASPSGIVSDLIVLREKIEALSDTDWQTIKLAEIDALIKNCLGLYLEAVAENPTAAPGDSIQITFEAVNRSPIPVSIVSIVSEQLSYAEVKSSELRNNEVLEIKMRTKSHADVPVSQPYWLVDPGTLGTYTVTDPALIGKAENDPAVEFTLEVDIQGKKIKYPVPLVYKYRDPVEGEAYKPFYLVPPITLNFKDDIQVFYNEVKENTLTVRANSEDQKGTLSIKGPKGFAIEPRAVSIDLEKAGEEMDIPLVIIPSGEASQGDMKASFDIVNGQTMDQSLVQISYDHIPDQIYLPGAACRVVNIDLKKRGEQIGYVEGAGDVIPEVLSSIGYEVQILSEGDLKSMDLQAFDAIVLGIRALNTQDRIDYMMPLLLNYCEKGGTLVLQYNTSYRMKTSTFAPYPLQLSRDRVTQEDAPVEFLLPDHPVLNHPNKLTKADFDGWVQERGLYFPDEWDEQYEAILRWNDKGESPKDGSLLIADYGEGHYIYTGISLFRELPAGVPGAYRLLANLVSYGHE